MNKDVLDGKRRQTRSQARRWWGTRRVTADDRDRVAGKYEKFIGLFQEKYGYTRERAEEEFNRRMAKHEAHPKKSGFRTHNAAG